MRRAEALACVPLLAGVICTVGCSPGDADQDRVVWTSQKRGPRADEQLQSIRAELGDKLLARNCSPDPSYNLECRNFVVACAVEKPTTPADRANGVARRITFWTSYIARGAKNHGWRGDTTRWIDTHGYVVVQVRPDGTWATPPNFGFGTIAGPNYNDSVVDGFCKAKNPGERVHRF